MEILIRDARFWVALLLLIRSVLFYVVPAFPEQIWVAIDTFVGVVLGILAGNNVVQTRRAATARSRRSEVAGLRRGTVGRGSSFLWGRAGFTQASPSFAERWQMGNVKLRSVFGIFLIVAAASLTALAGCAPLRLQPAAPAADAGASRNAGGVRPGDTNVTNLVAEGDVAVGGDLTVTGECVGCGGGTTVETLDDIPTLRASKPMTATLADAGQLVLNGGAFDEDVSVLRVKTSENVETLSVTEDGEVWLGTSGRFGIGPPGDYKVYMDTSGVSVVGNVDVTGRLSGEKYVHAMDAFGTIHFGGGVYTNQGASWLPSRVSLPGATPGLTECFYVVAAQTFYVDPASGDQIHVLTNATGDRISSATPGDSICLVAIDYTNWAAYSKSGTWADAN